MNQDVDNQLGGFDPNKDKQSVDNTPAPKLEKTEIEPFNVSYLRLTHSDQTMCKCGKWLDPLEACGC